MLSDNVLNTLITTLGTTIVSVVVAVSRRRTRNELREVLESLKENSDDTKHIKRELTARKSGETLASDIPVDIPEPTLGDSHNGAKASGEGSQ
jgi:hypothetical protein